MEDEEQGGRAEGEEEEEEEEEEDAVWHLDRAHDGPRTREREGSEWPPHFLCPFPPVCSWAILPTHNTPSHVCKQLILAYFVRCCGQCALLGIWMYMPCDSVLYVVTSSMRNKQHPCRVVKKKNSVVQVTTRNKQHTSRVVKK